jgi:hypothetical protein
MSVASGMVLTVVHDNVRWLRLVVDERGWPEGR